MRNYLAVLIRNIRRERLYAAINIAGLALGFACCLILGLFLKSELTYDQHFEGHERIYRLENEFTTAGNADQAAATSRVIGPMLQEEYPDVVTDYVRFESNGGGGSGMALRRDDKVFYWKNSYYVSPNLFKVFRHQILLGDPDTALQARDSVAISATLAQRYFGDGNPIGQILTTEGGGALKVSLVFADLPPNTHLKYDVLLSYNAPYLLQDDSATRRRQSLGNIRDYTYLVMAPGFRESTWAGLSVRFYDKNMAEILKPVNTTWRSWVQPLRDVHLKSRVSYDQPSGNRLYLFGCAAVGLIILIIACINYMNLATARATRRARSIGVRKILGASRGTLALQFMGEAMLFALLALVLGAVMVEVVLKFTPINALMGDQVRFDLLRDPALGLWLLGVALSVGVLSGIYPALYLSSWAPLTALAGRPAARRASLRAREFLVLLQFTISATAIACTLLMMAQMHYMSTMPLGFERDNRLVVTLRGSTTIDKIPAIRDQLLRDSHVQGVGVAAQLPGESAGITVMQVEKDDGSMAQQLVSTLPAGENFEKVMGMQIVQGRDLSSRLLTDVGANVLVNEAMVRRMGWTNPLGRRVTAVRGVDGRVVGVVKDFNFKSLRTLIEPLVVHPLDNDMSKVNRFARPFEMRQLIIRVAPQDMPGTLARIARVMASADVEHPFEYRFLDESLDAMYKSERQLTKLIGVFAAISIFIACLGLFGLSAFTTEQRTREIGTRKVLGAGSWQIVALLARPILVLVGLAAALAAVLSWFAVDEWLASFAYRAEINWMFFALTALLAAAVAFITVALQSWKTANADPVNTLRHV